MAALFSPNPKTQTRLNSIGLISTTNSGDGANNSNMANPRRRGDSAWTERFELLKQYKAVSAFVTPRYYSLRHCLTPAAMQEHDGKWPGSKEEWKKWKGIGRWGELDENCYLSRTGQTYAYHLMLHQSTHKGNAMREKIRTSWRIEREQFSQCRIPIVNEFACFA